MRFADAEHMQLAALRARLPGAGRIYLLFGLALLVAGCWYAADARATGGVLIVALVGWARAWMHQVGSLWRTTLLAAALQSAVLLSLPALAAKGAA